MSTTDRGKEYLFVYGTLMRGLESSKTRFLNAHARFAGEATLIGCLYDLGEYPGLTVGEGSATEVTGHLFKVEDPTSIFSVLDPYEGITPDSPDRGPYIRRRIEVQFQEKAVYCWTYLYNGPTVSLPRIPSGNYLQYVGRNPRHQRFIKSA